LSSFLGKGSHSNKQTKKSSLFDTDNIGKPFDGNTTPDKFFFRVEVRSFLLSLRVVFGFCDTIFIQTNGSLRPEEIVASAFEVLKRKLEVFQIEVEGFLPRH